MFASNLAVTMSVTALLKDQNDKIILNKFTVYTRGNTAARRRIKFTFFFFFFAAAAHPTPYRESVKRLINSSWPNGHRTLSEQIHVLSAQFRPCSDNLSEQFFCNMVFTFLGCY